MEYDAFWKVALQKQIYWFFCSSLPATTNILMDYFPIHLIQLGYNYLEGRN